MTRSDHSEQPRKTSHTTAVALAACKDVLESFGAFAEARFNLLRRAAAQTQSGLPSSLGTKIAQYSRKKVMLRSLRCDLHIHTCLSPCAELDMFPRAIIEKSIAEKIDVIAICDHNASENAAHVIKLSQGKPITVLPGMEIATIEEVHLLALFDDLESLYGLQRVIYDHLPGVNREEIFGCQAVVNDRDEVEGMNEHLLIGAVDLPLDEVIDLIHKLGGLAVASHIDRPSFSVISQLGIIDPSMRFDALEISHAMGIGRARRQYPELAAFAMITSSDAHFIRDLGRACTTIVLREGNIRELSLAFQNRKGRYVKTT